MDYKIRDTVLLMLFKNKFNLCNAENMVYTLHVCQCERPSNTRNVTYRVLWSGFFITYFSVGFQLFKTYNFLLIHFSYLCPRETTLMDKP